MTMPGSKSQTQTPAEYVSQTGRTVLNLREMLLRGDFQPGERISELPLVARLGVSRTPIRLALDRLAHEGLLSVAPSGGFLVREFTVADIWDAIEMRGVLEGTAARLAAERLTSGEELKALRQHLDGMDAYDTPDIAHPTIDAFARYMDLNEAFHSTIVDLAKSPLLKQTLDRVTSLPFAAPSAVVFANSRTPRAAEMFAVGQEHHHAIAEAIEQRQGSRAESVACEHARLSRRNLEAILSNPSILRGLPGASLIRLPAAV